MDAYPDEAVNRTMNRRSRAMFAARITMLARIVLLTRTVYVHHARCETNQHGGGRWENWPKHCICRRPSSAGSSLTPTANPPMTYLTTLCAEHLARLLRETDLSVEQAMAQVGWHSRGHAARLFRQAVGVTRAATANAVGTAAAAQRNVTRWCLCIPDLHDGFDAGHVGRRWLQVPAAHCGGW
ncbi:helix-turn-helix domain-containing protein [Brevibacterium otitidis]|uniref:Helix-turn-helix domain-containing protein n=1 Tax=Brevibacterium otitidis TaxID=53364 RepID=A0ABV5X723_9MICO|nr:hypothetical protein GCM10023233_30480 [Brevibacterium otitidis]